MLDATIEKTIVDVIRLGGTRSHAAAAAGVSPTALFTWLRRGRAGEEPYAQFAQHMKKADGEARTVATKAIRTALEGGTWQAAAWWLERRYPKEWARRDPTPAKVDPKDRPPTREEAIAELKDLLTREPELAALVRSAR